MKKLVNLFYFSALAAVFAIPANADIVVTSFTSSTTLPVASGDLLESADTSGWSGRPDEIADGLNADAPNQNDGTQSAGVTLNGTYEFALDISTNTLGYDITSVDVFSAWCRQLR